MNCYGASASRLFRSVNNAMCNIYSHSLLLGICGLIKSPFLGGEAGEARLPSQKWGLYFLSSPLGHGKGVGTTPQPLSHVQQK